MITEITIHAVDDQTNASKLILKQEVEKDEVTVDITAVESITVDLDELTKAVNKLKI